jgi:hypothetical protein
MNELLNDLSMAEKFLGCWAIVATLCAVYYHTRYKAKRLMLRQTQFLLCEVASGDIKPTYDGNYYKVESNDLVVEFRRKD